VNGKLLYDYSWNERVFLKVGVDARVLAGSKHLAGVSQYTRHLLLSMLDNQDDVCLFAGFRHQGNETIYHHLGLQGDDERVVWSRLPSSILEQLWKWKLWPMERVIGNRDVFFAPNFFPPYLSKTPFVCTVHDLSFVRYPEWFPEGVAEQRQKLLAETMQQADGVIAVSKFTADELMDVWPQYSEKVHVIHEAAGMEFQPVEAGGEEKLCEKLDIKGPFILYLGTLEKRKNIDSLLSGFSLFRQRYPEMLLVLAGSMGFGSDVFLDAINQGEEEGWIYRLGFVDQDDLPALYAASQGVCYLSLYEGFGLPPLEAVSCGAPVLVSDIPVLREILGDAAWYAKPDDPAHIADSMSAMVQSSLSKRKGLPRHYSWQHAADETRLFLRQFVA